MPRGHGYCDFRHRIFLQDEGGSEEEESEEEDKESEKKVGGGDDGDIGGDDGAIVGEDDGVNGNDEEEEITQEMKDLMLLEANLGESQSLFNPYYPQL